MKNNRLSRFAIPYVIWMALFVVAPIIMVVIYAFSASVGGFTLDNFAKMGTYTVVFTRSFKLALIATAICVLIGYPVSYKMSKEGPWFQRLAMVLIMLPMWMNFLLRTYSWMTILENNGLLNQLLQSLGLISAPLKILNTETAVIIGMIHLLVPYMVLSLVGVLQSIDPNVEYAAYSLGASPLQTFSKVVFPLSLPGIISGCVLVFTMSMTSYVTPKLLGGSKFRMMATMVVQEMNVNFDWGAASAISYILLAVILLVQIAVVLCTSGYMKRMGGGK